MAYQPAGFVQPFFTNQGVKMANGGGDVGALDDVVSALVEALQAPTVPVMWVRLREPDGKWHRLASYRRDTRQFVTACTMGFPDFDWNRLEFSVLLPPVREACEHSPCAGARAGAPDRGIT